MKLFLIVVLSSVAIAQSPALPTTPVAELDVGNVTVSPFRHVRPYVGASGTAGAIETCASKGEVLPPIRRQLTFHVERNPKDPHQIQYFVFIRNMCDEVLTIPWSLSPADIEMEGRDSFDFQQWEITIDGTDATIDLFGNTEHPGTLVTLSKYDFVRIRGTANLLDKEPEASLQAWLKLANRTVRNGRITSADWISNGEALSGWIKVSDIH